MESATANHNQSLQVQIRFPRLLDPPHVLPQENNMVRTKRFPAQGHIRFFRCAITFTVVAGVAGCNEVFPCILAVAAPGQHVVDGKVGCASAILTFMSVALHDILAGKHDIFEGDTRIPSQPNNRRVVEFGTYRANFPIRIVMQELSLVQK